MLPKLLITGSSGIIGKVLQKGLADSFEIYGADLNPNENTNFYKVDISDYKQISSVLRDIVPVPYIIHLAGDSNLNAIWGSVLKNNIIGTKNVYEASKAYNVKKIVFASSTHVTGGYEKIILNPQNEKGKEIVTTNDEINPDSFYAVSKIFGEAIARLYWELYSIKSICLRIGTVLSDNDPTKDERHGKTWLSHKDLIQLVKKSILSNVKFAIYYGVSNNKNRFLDISNARKEIGYLPNDDASKL